MKSPIKKSPGQKLSAALRGAFSPVDDGQLACAYRNAEPPYARPSSIIRHTAGGNSGSSRGSTPNAASAAAAALALTPPTGMLPPSPAALQPSGVLGAGYSSHG